MSRDKKVYAIVTTGTGTYAAHIEEYKLWRFGNAEIVSRAKYREVRASGVPSWGAQETAAKMGKPI